MRNTWLKAITNPQCLKTSSQNKSVSELQNDRQMAYITPITFSTSPLCLCCIHLSYLHLSLKFHQIIKLPASSISAAPFLVSKFGHPLPILSGCHTLPQSSTMYSFFFQALHHALQGWREYWAIPLRVGSLQLFYIHCFWRGVKELINFMIM